MEVAAIRGHDTEGGAMTVTVLEGVTAEQLRLALERVKAGNRPVGGRPPGERHPLVIIYGPRSDRVPGTDRWVRATGGSLSLQWYDGPADAACVWTNRLVDLLTTDTRFETLWPSARDRDVCAALEAGIAQLGG